MNEKQTQGKETTKQQRKRNRGRRAGTLHIRGLKTLRNKKGEERPKAFSTL